MTIKENKQPFSMNINMHKIFLWATIAVTIFAGLYSIIAGEPIHKHINVILIPVIFTILFFDEQRMGITYQHKVISLVVGAVILLGITFQNISINNTKFIEMVKKDHPQLIIGGGCGKKPTEIGAYKLVKINNEYLVKATSGRSYNPNDLSVYTYEEF